MQTSFICVQASTKYKSSMIIPCVHRHSIVLTLNPERSQDTFYTIMCLHSLPPSIYFTKRQSRGLSYPYRYLTFILEELCASAGFLLFLVVQYLDILSPIMPFWHEISKQKE
jgi:hypothetical protein